jgi:alpha-L-fucosidase
MGSTKKLKGFTFTPRHDGLLAGVPDRYRFETSLDGTTWSQAAEGEFGNLRENPVKQTVSFAPASARYFRFTGLHALEKNHVSVAEIGVVETK